MMKRRILLLCLCLACLFPLSSAGIWMQMNNAKGLSLDLSQTIPLPTSGSNWGSAGYGDSNYVAKVGSNGINQKVYLDIQCSSITPSGEFALASDSGNGELYRTFKIGLAYRKAVGSTHSNYEPANGTSFFAMDQPGVATYPLPAATGGISYSWTDLLIVMDDLNANGDVNHIQPGNDYKALLTIHAYSEDNTYSEVITVPLQGQYEYEPSASIGDNFFSIDDGNVLADLRALSTSEYVTLGAIDFKTISMNSSSANKRSYTISISPSGILGDSADFKMRRVSGTMTQDSEYNSLPIKVLIEGKTVIGSNQKGANIDGEGSTRSASEIRYQQTNAGGGGECHIQLWL